jgi:Uma2 family endonuclease
MTFEEAVKLDRDTWRGDIVDGVWVAVPKSTWRHGAILGNIVFLLKLHARSHPGLSVAVADPGVKLSRDPDVLRGPDAAVIRAERVPTGKGVAGKARRRPDLTVAVVGDGQTVTGMLKKAAEYLRAGAKAVWVVDPDPAQVAVITAEGLTVLGSDDTIEGGDALPGFACTVSEFFA